MALAWSMALALALAPALAMAVELERALALALQQGDGARHWSAALEPGCGAGGLAAALKPGHRGALGAVLDWQLRGRCPGAGRPLSGVIWPCPAMYWLWGSGTWGHGA